jgi:hypothetical protein
MMKKRDFYEKNTLQASFVQQTECAADKTYHKKCIAGPFFWLNPEG